MAKVVIISGAGISAESGISTFRASDGLWEKHRVEDVCTAGCLKTNREETIGFYDNLRGKLEDKKPNYAHLQIAVLKKQYKEQIAIITQNVDNLFEKAGIPHEDVIHLHGYMTDLECESCGHVYDAGYKKQIEACEGRCPKCHSNQIRPSVVMFGEAAPKYQELLKSFDDCEMMVVIGTSGYVINTDMYLNPKIKKSVLNNLVPSIALNDELYSKVLYKPATEAIDEIVKYVVNFMD